MYTLLIALKRIRWSTRFISFPASHHFHFSFPLPAHPNLKGTGIPFEAVRETGTPSSGEKLCFGIIDNTMSFPVSAIEEPRPRASLFELKAFPLVQDWSRKDIINCCADKNEKRHEETSEKKFSLFLQENQRRNALFLGTLEKVYTLQHFAIRKASVRMEPTN